MQYVLIVDQLQATGVEALHQQIGHHHPLPATTLEDLNHLKDEEIAECIHPT